jgi:hypothetical protein
MRAKRCDWLGVMAFCYSLAAWSQDFPPPPSTADAAAASGLRRIEAEELRQRYGGTRILKGASGEILRLNLHADGTLDYADDKGVADTGSWAILPRNGGMVCRRYSKQMGGRICLVYFAAPDEGYWFGYSADSGQWRDTTRSIQAQ